VLFSDDNVSRFMNNTFEAAWESVRPVPLVTIDFGNGHVLTRTLNGNIATYVCTADGKMLDVLPGVYEPNTYLDRLDQFGKLHQWIKAAGTQAVAKLTEYHRKQAVALADNNVRAVFQKQEFQSKKKVENALKLVFLPASSTSTDPTEKATSNVELASLKSREDLARWDLLAQDTEVNESIRRKTIHDFLAGKPMISPDAITKWLYREVLNADIDDPYLGLGKVLFASYPFKDAG
jgi:hypothetical protein